MRSRFLSAAVHGIGGTVVRVAIAGLALAGGLTLASSSVFAALTAQAYNPTPMSITGGTLKLVQTDNGSGFTTAISAIAPGDTMNRFVDYTNSGTLDAQGLALSITDSDASTLTDSATVGMSVGVSQCSVAWTTTSGVCNGTVTQLGLPTALVSLKTTPLALPVTSLTAGSTSHLKFSMTLPNNDEVTSQGSLPGTTVQGAAAAITWILTASQRTAIVNNS